MGAHCWLREILKFGKISGDMVTSKLLPLMFFFVFLGSSAKASAEGDDLEDFLRMIQDRSDQVHSFSSEFTQEKKLSLFSRPVVFQGKLFIVRPDRLRWEFISPVPSVLILKGDEGIRCNDKATSKRFQLSADPVMKMVAKQLWLWLGGDYKELARNHKLEKLGPAALLITPENKSTADFIETVAIAFDENTLQPLQVKISEPGGDSTRISFHFLDLNSPIPEKYFTDCVQDE